MVVLRYCVLLVGISVAFQVDPFVGEGVYNEWTAKVQRKSEADLPVAAAPELSKCEEFLRPVARRVSRTTTSYSTQNAVEDDSLVSMKLTP